MSAAPSWFIEGIEIPNVGTIMPTKRRGAEVELRCIFPPGFQGQYSDIAAHADVAGNYTLHDQKIANGVAYREHDFRDDTAGVVDNVVLSVDAPSSLSETPSFWGALDAVDDGSVLDGVDEGATYDLVLSFTIVALKRDIASRSALENELAEGLV